MESKSADIAIVGAGIVGLAHAYMALRKGYKVVLFDRDQEAMGASVRNFGLIWPIGQLPGNGLDYALRSRAHWLELSAQVGFWINPSGSLHLAHYADEWEVLQEFYEWSRNSPYQASLLNKGESCRRSSAINTSNLQGSLWSSTECTVNPREAIRKIPLWLQQRYGLILKMGHSITEISLPLIKSSRESWKVEKVFVCNGADFQTLYPELFLKQDTVKCKLQMMKAVSSNPALSIGPSLCGGLTLRHYPSFKNCPSLAKLNQRYDGQFPQYKQHGIHVLVSQNAEGELILGDSHHYGLNPEPFDSALVEDFILTYLNTITALGDYSIVERWHGIYTKARNDFFVEEVDPGVTVVNGLGGAGMTLSFGLAEEIISKL